MDHLEHKTSQVPPYWIAELKKLSKPWVKALIGSLSSEHPLGYLPENGLPKPTSMMFYIREQKELYPERIVLTRCGDFYETFGIDSLILMEYANLNGYSV